MNHLKLKPEDPVCLRPRYLEGQGDVTELMASDKSIRVVSKTVKTVLRNFFIEACVDRLAVRKRASEITGRDLLVPLYLNERSLFVPLKMRRPKTPGDSCYGYVNYFAVESVGLDEGLCQVRFKNGTTVPLLSGVSAARKAWVDAASVFEAGGFGGLFKSEKESVSEYFYGENRIPATKGDLEAIRKDRWAIKEVLGVETKIF